MSNSETKRLAVTGSYFAALPNYSAKLPNRLQSVFNPAKLGNVIRPGAKASNANRRTHSVAGSGRAIDLTGFCCDCFSFAIAMEFPQHNRIAFKKGSAGRVIVA